jgi:hypothetical protein
MDMTYFIIWVVITSMGILIFPIGNRIEKLDDNHRLKKWWKKHITDTYEGDDF